MLQRFLLLWLTLLCFVALKWPTWGVGVDPFAATRGYLPWMISAAMFAIGCLLPRDEIAQVLRRWPTVIGGTAAQYLTMPFLAWSIGTLSGLPDDWMIGVILVGAVPGAMASNVITMTARGNVSYSVSLTTTATLLSPVVVPTVLYLTLNQTGVDAGALARQAFWGLVLQVFLPVVLGHFLARNFPRVEHLTNRYAGIIANLVILWIIAVVVNDNHADLSQMLPRSHGKLVLVLLAVNILGYGGGWLGAILMGLPEAKRRALIIEVGMQNAGLGSVLATQLFPVRPAVALPCALYTFGCMLTGILLAQYWSRREPVDRPINHLGQEV